MPTNTPKWVILHHSGGTDANPLADTSNQKFSDIDNWHKVRWDGTTKSQLGYYCGYHYVIEADGVVTQARNDLEGGAHTIGMNYVSIGICLIGNFDATLPTSQQVKSLSTLLSKLQSRYLIPSSRIVPHRTFAKKTCFGNNLESIWGEKVLQESAFADGYIRGILKKLVDLRIIVEPKLAMMFGANGPFNSLEAD